MARLLIRGLDNHHPDPVLDLREMFKAGDVICVAEDGHVWGAKEQPPAFQQVDLPGPASDYQQYIAPAAEAEYSLPGDFLAYRNFFMDMVQDVFTDRGKNFSRPRRYRYVAGDFVDKERKTGF